eukprot:COSAG01_NODE_2170_length_8236_cov_17.597272_7_plen_111_part_00
MSGRILRARCRGCCECCVAGVCTLRLCDSPRAEGGVLLVRGAMAELRARGGCAGHRRLLLAGEAACRTHPATAHGAWLSGVGAATHAYVRTPARPHPHTSTSSDIMRLVD